MMRFAATAALCFSLHAVAAEPLPNADGTLSTQQFVATVAKHLSDINNCAQRQHDREGGNGTMKVTFRINTSGRVEKVTVLTEELKKSVLATCISQAAANWVFPSHRTQSPEMPYSFSY
jgi:hypothetical protein